MSDLIDRQAAIEAVNEYLRLSEVSKTVQNMTSIQAILRWLPTAEPKTGRWIVIDETEPRRYGCSNCKRLVWHVENYCPNCGARMKGEADEH